MCLSIHALCVICLAPPLWVKLAAIQTYSHLILAMRSKLAAWGFEMQDLIWIRRQSPKWQWRLAPFIGCAQENKPIGLSFWKVQLYYTLFSVLREVLQENLARLILQYFFYRVLLETHLAKKPARLIL